MKDLLKKLKVKNIKSHNYNSLSTGFLLSSLLLFFVVLFLLNPSPLKADDNFGLNRIRTCSPLGGESLSGTAPTPDGLNYSIVDGGQDFSFDPSNGYCLAVVLPQYAAVKLSIAAMNRICGTSTRIPSAFPNPVLDSFDIGRAGYNCATSPSKTCCAPWGTSLAALSSFIIGAKSQHAIAQEAFENTAICGSGLDDNWVQWNSKTMVKDIPVKKKEVEDVIYGENGWIAKCNRGDTESCNNLNAGLQKKEYREWYYGGVERQDNGQGACPDVTRLPSSDDQYTSSAFDDGTNSSGGKYPTQRYYLRGTESGNYACERFNYRNNMGDPLTGQPLSEQRKNEYEYAHNCCIERSRSTICIERKHKEEKEYVFCAAGNRCKLGNGVGGVSYNANFMENQQLICASSYDLCPYNFNVGGGTLTCDYFKDGITGQNGRFVPVLIEDIQNKSCGTKSEIRNEDCSFNSKAGKCKNYCQYLNHCVVSGGGKHIYNSSIISPFFSQACIDFIGDSKNQYAYGETQSGLNISFTEGPRRHFSAPIVQCVKETLENIFHNRAGHSKCSNANEYPDRNGRCLSGTYVYQKDKPVEGQSFLYSIQEKLKSGIRIVLTISIMMQGFKMLLTGTPFKHSEIIMYIVKIGLVLFFATGSAWQQFFFSGVYNASSTFSAMVMNIKTSDVEAQRDGCQFGKITTGSSSTTIAGQYPEGKEYLAIFDTFDCKIARYLGFGPSATLANIAKLILPFFLSPALGAIGIFFAIFLVIFGILMIIAAIRSLHIFLTSAFAIILLVYASPITITMVLFARTKQMFESWLMQLIGYSLQPVLLFAYIGLFITVFETLVSGSATYAGIAPQKQLICDKVCVHIDGTTSSKLEDLENCNLEDGDKILNPMSDSIACIMGLGNDHFTSIPVLQAFGISIPIIKDFFSDEGRQKLLTMLKGLLVIYILVGFIDDIPSLASSIMGGNILPRVQPNPSRISGKLAGGLSAVTRRAYRGSLKLGGNLRDFGKSAAQQVSNKLTGDKKGSSPESNRSKPSESGASRPKNDSNSNTPRNNNSGGNGVI